MKASELAARPLYLREAQVAAEYGLSRPWLRKARMLKHGPVFVKLNRVVLYERREVEEYLAAHRQPR